MKYYQIEYRQSGEQMLGSEDYRDQHEAIKAFERAEFFGKCDVIELHQYFEDRPTFEGSLLETKTKK